MSSTYATCKKTYSQEGDYLLPNFEVPDNPKVGVWGERRRKYLRDYRKSLYTGMMLSDTLNAHLEEVDKSASEMFGCLTQQLKIRDGVTEKLKVSNQLEWVWRMNRIHHEATTMVMNELIYI